MSTPAVLPGASKVAYLQTEFLERVAHELRGPAGVTSGALDEIELALGPDADKVRAYFLMARRGMQRVLRTAQRLERTAQLERGTVEWAKVPTDLRNLSQQAAKEAELLEGRRGVRVEVSSSEEACSVAADPGWMLAAIGEVVDNAIRFARSVVSVRTEICGSEVTITTTDDGPGFAGPAAPRFVPPFGRRGVGLSLALVSDVIAAHGGQLEINGARKAGEAAAPGAHVVLTLPRLGAREA